MSLYDAYVGINQEFSSVTSALDDGRTNICVVGSIVDNRWAITNNTDITLRPNVVITIMDDITNSDNCSLSITSGTLIFMTSKPINSSNGSSITINNVSLVMLASTSYITCPNLTISQSNINTNYCYCSTDNNVVVSIKNCVIHGTLSLYSGTYESVDVRIQDNTINGSIILFPNMSYLPDTVGYPISYRVNGNRIDVLSLSANMMYDMSYFLGVIIDSNTIGTLTTTGGPNTIAYSEISNNNITIAMTNNTSTYDTTITENTIVSSLELVDVQLTNITNNTINEVAISTMNRSTFNNNTLVDLYITSSSTESSNNGSMINMNNLAGTFVSESPMYGCEVSNNFVLGSLAFKAPMVNNTISSNWSSGIYYNSTCQSDKITSHYNTNITFGDSVTKACIENNDAFIITSNNIMSNCKISNNNLTLTLNGKNENNNITNNTGSIICNGKVNHMILTSNNNISATFNKKVKNSIIANNVLLSPINMRGKRNIVKDNINGRECC